MSLTEAQRERMARERTLNGYEHAVAKATAYGWSAVIAHKMARKVVRKMRKGEAEETAIRREVVRKPEKASAP